MNKESRKELKINKVLASMGVVCSILAIAIIILPSLNKSKIETLANSSKQMKNNYTTTTESNTWDISKNGDGSVIATLDGNGLFTIAGSGAMKGWSSNSGAPWWSVGGKIKNVKIENGITNIGGFAFSGSGLTRIEIPASVTSIAESAFLWCKSLTNIEVDANNEKYCDENGVLCTKNKKEIIRYPEGKTETTYTIINGVTSIGDRAFEYCKNLTSIEIPESVTSIRSEAFSNCTNLTNIEIPESVTSIEDYVFKGCTSLTSIEIPESVTSIGRYAFRDCESLISIEIPESVTSLGNYAFDGCTSLTSIKLPEGVTSMGDGAFRDCESLISIEIPESVTSLGNYAFDGCTSLTSIKLPKSVTSMGDGVFSGCTSLTNIEVDANNEKYCEENGVLYTKDKKEIISYPAGKIETKYTIVNGVTSIGGGAFKGCKNLTTIELPKSVTRIGMHAFSNCKSLTSLEIPEGVTSIGNNAFNNCKVTEVAETINNLIELPKLIKRVQNESDILYSNEEFTLTNCIIEDGKIKISKGEAYGQIKINGGALDGLIYVITYTEWDISENGDGTIIATLDGNWGLTIAGNGKMKYWSSRDSVPWYSARNQIKNVKIENGVTSIEYYAFSGCTSLTSIEIPESVTTIREDAFSNCTSLTSVEMPSSVTSIGRRAFSDCTNLTSIRISTSVASIGAGAFQYCKGLTSVEIPSSVTSIEDCAFSNCISLTSIKIPASVTSIGKSVFYNCTSLTNIKIRSTQSKNTIEKIEKMNNSYEIIDKEGNKISDKTETVKTGNRLKLDNDKICTIIVIGDTAGDGAADIKDILAINKHRLNKAELVDEYLIAGDVNGDGIVDIKDILQINKFRLGKIPAL